MKRMQRKSLPCALRNLISGALLLTAASAFAATAGVITHLSGTLTSQQADGKTKILSVNSEINEGDELTTQQDTYARIKFVDGAELVLRPNSQLKISAYSYAENKPQSDNIVMNLVRGGLRALTGLIGKRNRDQFQLRTGTATIGIRGTHFGALLCNNDCANIPTTTGQAPGNGLHLDVASGAIIVSNSAGSMTFNIGQFGYVPNGQTLPQIVPPESGIQVTMPSGISQNRAAGQGIGKTKDAECSL